MTFNLALIAYVVGCLVLTIGLIGIIWELTK